MKTDKIVFFLVFCVILVFGLFLYSRADVFYAKLGHYYYKNNNIEKAQQYFEKSLNLKNDSALREEYVNSIINSPLTIQAQEKLVKIAEGDINDSASASAEYFLYNLKREIHNKYPLNYVQQASYSGRIVHWGKLPVTYTFKNTRGIPQNLIKAVNGAFDEWQRASSCRVIFDYVKSGNADITVNFVQNKKTEAEYGQKYVVAYTVPNIIQDKLQNMVINLNVYDLEGNLYTENQLYNTSLHEVFHALGLMGHSSEEGSIMYMSKNNEAIKCDTKTELNDADKITLELLYKTKPDITNANELNYDYIPYLILGNGNEINYTKKKEAKNYIKKAPNLSGGYIDMAEILVSEKKYTSAIGNLEKALRLANDKDTKYMAYYNLAVCYFYTGNYDLSLDYTKLAAELFDKGEVHYLKAENYVKKEDFDNAVTEYEYLISISPDNIDYAISLANIYIKQYNYLKARKILKGFVKNNPAEKNNERLKNYKMLLL